jgi:glutamate N-acetyltransferase/amino-acid N-acetyltransferase
VTRVIDGGITAPSGFRAAGVACGIKRAPAAGQPRALDLALVTAHGAVPTAAVFTTNQAVAAPVVVSRDHLARSGGRAAAIVINSGCANACTGAAGHTVARQMAEATAQAVGCDTDRVLVASTGVIGVALEIEKVRAGVAEAARSLGPHGEAATRAIMTTDPFPKSYAVVVDTPSGPFTVGGMAKGSGMIEPRMATMIGVLTTDARIDPVVLAAALRSVCDETFNAITVDGECSTNDCVFAMASGTAAVAFTHADAPALVEGLREVAGHLAREIVRGGEGATKLVTITVTGATSWADAQQAARTVANSPLVKTAIHGGDPNWGRLIAAAGRSGAAFSLDHASVAIDDVPLFVAGVPHDERAGAAATALAKPTIRITIDLGTGGSGTATMWTCDLSAEYVRINGQYRS